MMEQVERVYSVAHLLEGVKYRLVQGELPERVEGITSDSRRVAAGWVFVAVAGTQHDGHSFIEASLQAGASLIVVERDFQLPSSEVPILQVENSAESLGIMASNFYGRPSDSLKLVGVTGTNGKTSVATLLYHLCQGLGYRAGLLSTIENRILDEVLESTHTTPDALALNGLLAKMVANGVEYAFMEVSSHALVQRRVAGVRFAGAVFTNLSRDHLDYHGTFAAYRDAKKLLFDGLDVQAFALANRDDRNAEVMLQNSQARRCYYSAHEVADYNGKLLHEDADSMELEIAGVSVHVLLHGRFNLYNLLAVYGVADLLGLGDSQEVLRQLSVLEPVRGRFQGIVGPERRLAVVDYAHTPDALSKVIDTLRIIAHHRDSQLISLVGCGGERDKGKRPDMGAIASSRSLWTVLTSDNPRGEEPGSIIAEMYAGVRHEYRSHVFRIEDRREAILYACMLSEPGDVILIAGKGHENYQEIAGVRHPFDDAEEVRQAFSQLD
ncbi:MAG: UDP-N-acetylmuramoyl-L-alanyl-D-glutamate--2,6-diaminopimelate ligase [Bacteroidetes bacterium]|nr:MAG: UDP-N-acetylmuramoyl-L-alanyl-D-glutamate--2,6-diaminopimelate ligase [Bacteroidota bacterium]